MSAPGFDAEYSLYTSRRCYANVSSAGPAYAEFGLTDPHGSEAASMDKWRTKAVRGLAFRERGAFRVRLES